jgi:hypothetical protein
LQGGKGGRRTALHETLNLQSTMVTILTKNTINQSIYGSTALVDLGCFLGFLIYTNFVGLLGREISPSQGRYLHTEKPKHRINARTHTHTYLKWDSNPRPQILKVLGKLDSGAGLGCISPHTYGRTPNFARTSQYPE